MDNRFFEKPILNNPYDYPSRHWELDASGQTRHQGGSDQRFIVDDTQRHDPGLTPTRVLARPV